MKQSVILIPSLSPDEKLISYVEELFSNGYGNIIIVNDGSTDEYQPIFTQLEQLGCVVLKHAVNYGKGRALKNGLNEFLNRFGKSENISGVITADSDGQHLVKDVIRMDAELRKMSESGKNGILLGVRDFGQSGVPLKSSFGNKLTCFFFRLLYGKKITDTQTGLRGFTIDAARAFASIKGERFEYETMMLVEAVRKQMPVQELLIETVYLENNKSTHFRPIQDSAMVYGILFGEFFKYTLSSLSASLIDLGCFNLMILLFPKTWGIWLATAIARVLSSVYNYLVNNKVVFSCKKDIKQTLWKYYLLCLVQGICSAALVTLLVVWLKMPKMLGKVIVDTGLFFISYRVQQRYVFGTKK